MKPGGQRAKGAVAERAAAALLTQMLSLEPPASRYLREGRADDCGDIDGCGDLTVQVKHFADEMAALRSAIRGVKIQQRNAGTSESLCMVKVSASSLWLFAWQEPGREAITTKVNKHVLRLIAECNTVHPVLFEGWLLGCGAQWLQRVKETDQ